MTFFNSYSYKIKNRVLILILLLISFVAYKKKISLTLGLLKEENELNSKLKNVDNNAIKIKMLQKQLFQINQYLGLKKSKNKIQKDFLDFFNNNQKGLKIETIEEPIVFQGPDFKTNYYEIIYSGSFLQSLNFLYLLETKFNIIRVVSISFESVKQTNGFDDRLLTKLYIQNFSL